MTTPRDMSFDLHLPAGTHDAYVDRIKEIPEDKRTSWRYHVVRTGESLDGIASALHARPTEIAQVNDIAVDDPVNAGDELVIPLATPTASTHPQRYTVRRGDTLVTVADRFGISTDELRRWNHLPSNSLRTGTTITVAEPVRLAPSARTRSSRKSASHKGSTHTSSKSHTTSSHESSSKSSAKSTHSSASAKSSSTKKTAPKKKSSATR
jgi:membrane-bound lytic murein transglycosylase D